MDPISSFLENRKDTDRRGHPIEFGDICVVLRKDGIEYCVYIGRPERYGTASKFGRFISESGKTTCKLSSVLFIESPGFVGASSLREVKDLLQKLYEGNKKTGG